MSLRIALKRSLEDDDNGAPRPPKSTAYIPSLRGKKYDDGTSHPSSGAAPAAAAATSSRIVTPRRRRGRIENDSPPAKVIELPPVTGEEHGIDGVCGDEACAAVSSRWIAPSRGGG
eukprot:scaffold182697_cov40-Cyclotella_meneghiniana.AAC.1